MNFKKISPSFLSVVTAVFAASYLVNLLWEVLHSVLYDWKLAPLRNSVSFYVPTILRATLGDAVIVMSLFIVVALWRGGFSWIRFTRRADIIFLVVTGLAFAVAIEERAMVYHSWVYTSSMPLVFGIGLTPLVQLAATSLTTLWIVKRWNYAGQ